MAKRKVVPSKQAPRKTAPRKSAVRTPPASAGRTRAPQVAAHAVAPANAARSTAEILPSQRVTNCSPTRGIIIEAEPLAAGRLTRSIPALSDHRDPDWPAGDQQLTGACVGWAVGNGLLRWYFLKHLRLPSEAADLSVRYFWMAAKETDEFSEDPSTFLEGEGTSIGQAVKIAEKYGCLHTSDLPLSGALMVGTVATFKDRAGRLRLNHPIKARECSRLSFAGWLSTNSPLAVRINVDQSFYNVSAANPDLDDYHPFPNPENFGHAVTIVGFLPERNRFIIRNSWGQGWGDQGFAYAHSDYLFGKSPGEPRAVTEAFGIETNP